MKITNKTESYVKYANELFAPKETREIEIEKVYEHKDFEIKREKKLRRKLIKRKRKEVKDNGKL